MFVHMALQDYGPLFTVGYDYELNYPTAVGHAWVIDGMVSMYVPLGPDAYTIYFVHNNWGWDGAENGYYLGIVYDPLNYITFDPHDFNFKNIRLGLVYR
jgi:hypothetical protein